MHDLRFFETSPMCLSRSTKSCLGAKKMNPCISQLRRETKKIISAAFYTLHDGHCWCFRNPVNSPVGMALKPVVNNGPGWITNLNWWVYRISLPPTLYQAIQNRAFFIEVAIALTKNGYVPSRQIFRGATPKNNQPSPFKHYPPTYHPSIYRPSFLPPQASWVHPTWRFAACDSPAPRPWRISPQRRPLWLPK